MNMNQFVECRFFRGCFVANDSGKSYNITIPKYDRFYEYMKPYFFMGRVDSQTKVMIDDIFIEDADKTFFDEKTFTLKTSMLAKDKVNVVHSFDVVIEGLKLNKTSTTKIAYVDGQWTLGMVELQIPYHTSIGIVESLDE